MSKLKSGDLVVYQGYFSTMLKNGSTYTVAVVFGQTCSIVGVTGRYPTHLFSKVIKAQVQTSPEQPVLTPREVFTAIFEGVPLEYRTCRDSKWHTLSYPENVNIASFKLAEYRKQVQTVNLSGTVPKPVPYDSIEITDTVYTVYLSTNDVAVVNGKYALAGGLYWRTQVEAEQFRDALTKCFSTVPVLD